MALQPFLQLGLTVLAVLWLIAPVTVTAAEPTLPPEEGVSVRSPPVIVESPHDATWTDILDRASLGGHARFDYFTASKRLDGNRNLAGFTFQPLALPKLGDWADAKLEARLTDQDVTSPLEPAHARLLEAYVNLYLGAVDVRMGKQNIPWGRSDFLLSPTDILTPHDFTVLSARYLEDTRTGTTSVMANYYLQDYRLSVIWLPLFNPIILPFQSPHGILFDHDKRDRGAGADQGIALKLDRTGGTVDWSISYYNGRDVFPVIVPRGATHLTADHLRIQVLGADFATTIGRYGLRGEVAYSHPHNVNGALPDLKRPALYYVLGVDRSLTEDFSLALYAYQRIIFDYTNPFGHADPLVRRLAVTNAVVNLQEDPIQQGLGMVLRHSWFNKTLEAEFLSIWRTNRHDFFLRPMLSYAFTDVWRGYIGLDYFNGPRDSFFGRLEPMTAVFLEVRASF